MKDELSFWKRDEIHKVAVIYFFFDSIYCYLGLIKKVKKHNGMRLYCYLDIFSEIKYVLVILGNI